MRIRPKCAVVICNLQTLVCIVSCRPYNAVACNCNEAVARHIHSGKTVYCHSCSDCLKKSNSCGFVSSSVANYLELCFSLRKATLGTWFQARGLLMQQAANPKS